MADKLIFPIGFDLEAGLKQAQSDIAGVVRRVENAINRQSPRVHIDYDQSSMQRLMQEAKDIDRVLANIKNHYGAGQLKGLSIGFINTDKLLDALNKVENKIQQLQAQRTSLVNSVTTVEEIRRIDAAIKSAEKEADMLGHHLNKAFSTNTAISSQIIRIKQYSEELADIDRRYARLQAAVQQSGQSANTYEANAMLARRKEILEDITRITRTAAEAQKELFNVKGLGIGASQSTFGTGGDTGLSAITAQIEQYKLLQRLLQELEGEYERLKAMKAEGKDPLNASEERINNVLKARSAIQKKLAEVTKTAAQAQAELDQKAKTTADTFKRGKSAIDKFYRTLKLPETTIHNINLKIKALNDALTRVKVGSDAFNKISQELVRLGAKLDEARAKQGQLSGSVSKTGNAFRTQTSYLNILIQRLAVYSSMGAVMSFLTKIREVTAQFELQRISLGAIINDQTRANQLFSEIKQFALESPVKILDLAKYTKQLAAFQFETDTLFDTTKRIADISVGLGVPMDRLVLAFGHVKSASYLTGITLKQFALAGIPMLQLLADKYSGLEGRAVSAAEVMKRVHDRMVSFEDVNQIFTDLTSNGGMFYNMQEKQGNTLYGMWAKLGDAVSVMYDQIGNTGAVRSSMEQSISLLRKLMKNWKLVGSEVLVAAGTFAVFKIASKTGLLAHAQAGANLKRATKAVKTAQQELNAVTSTGTAAQKKAALAKYENARASFTLAVQETRAAASTNKFAGAMDKLKHASKTNWILAIVAALVAVGTAIYHAVTNANKLQKELDKIYGDAAEMSANSVAKFESIANRALTAIPGSTDQIEALDELKRTYGEILSIDDMTIEKLRAMNGEYQSLTDAIERYTYMKQKEKAAVEIEESYGEVIREMKTEKLKDNFEDLGLSEYRTAFWEQYRNYVEKNAELFNRSKKELEADASLQEFGETTMGGYIRTMAELRSSSEEQIQQMMLMGKTFYELAKAQGMSEEAAQNLAKSLAGDIGDFRTEAWAWKLTKAYIEQGKELEKLDDLYDAKTSQLGKFAKIQEKISEQMKKQSYLIGGKDAEAGFLRDQMVVNAQIKRWKEGIEEAFKEAGETIPTDFANIIERLDLNKPVETSTINFGKVIESIDKEKYPDLVKLMRRWSNEYDKLIPSDATISDVNSNIQRILNEVGADINTLNRYIMRPGDTLENFNKRVKEELDKTKEELYRFQVAMASATSAFANAFYTAKITELTEQAKILEEIHKLYHDKDKNKNKGGKQDPRLQALQEIANKMAEVNKEYDELLKKEGQTKALADAQGLFAKTFAQIQKTADKYHFQLPEFKVPETIADVQSWYKSVIDEIQRLDIKDAEKILIELDYKSGKAGIDKLQKDIETQLKELSDRISRTKTAKEFYEKILSQTGDFNLAKQLSEKLYDTFGAEANDRIFEYISDLVKATSAKLDLNIFNKDMSFDPQRLRKFAEAEKDALGGIESKAYQELIKLADDADKDFAKTIEGWLQATKKAETFSSKLTDIYRTTAAEIEKIQTAINNGRLDPSLGNDLIDGYRRKEAEEVAKLQYEAFKDSPMYVQMFDDLDHASTKMLENMKSRLEDMRDNWKNLDPTQLKELQSRLKEIDSQLAKRNPFREFTKGLKELYKLRKNGDSRGNTSRKKADNDVATWTEAYRKAEEELAKVLADKSSTAEQIAGAQQMLDYTKQQKEEAEKVAERWKKVEDSIGLSATELFQMMNWAGDIAKGIADISEAMGADEEDVQYWNDIASALGEISGGIQDIVNAAMNGNVIGIISSAITAIPKMFVGFSNLFSAGKIKKANKEIKRQQELLEQLEYTYSRLETAADKLFGGKYINNYKQQIKNLQAQAQAYQKQAEAEKSKGKKKDKEKIKEYEQAYRDMLDEIADLQSQLSAQFLGSDLASAARDFAKAWLDAYKEIGSTGAKTSDALKEKFSDMIENMVVEGALAAVMERALKPMFDMIDNMSEQDFYNENFWKRVVEQAEKGAANADAGAQTMMSFLEQAGINIRDINDEYTGIKRDIASASEETMNNVAAIGNTLMYYVSPIPTISENVAIMRQLMEQGDGAISTQSSIDTTALWNRHLELQQGIYNHTLRNVEVCEQMALKCATIAEDLHKVIVPRGKKGSFQVFVGGI